MGTVHKFKRPPKNRGQFQGWKPPVTPGGPKRPKRKGRWGLLQSVLVLVGLSAALTLGRHLLTSETSEAAGSICAAPQVHDGDTLRCGGERIRIANIDAPELPDSPKCTDRRRNGWCDYDKAAQSRDALRSFLSRGPLQVQRTGTDKYGRTLATVTVNGEDAGDYLIGLGLAKRWLR